MLNYLLGTVEILVNSTSALNLLAEMDFQCTDISIEDQTVSLRIPSYSYFKAKKILSERDILLEVKAIYGFPKILYRYKGRWGLAVGMILFTVLISLSGQFIWSVDIVGNRTVSDKEIIVALDKLGCGIGSKIKNIDFNMLQNDFLMECKDVAWIAVNMNGTCAKVEVTEIKRGSEATADMSNVVAKEDGQINQITVINGKAQVGIGNVVHKGDLLISGVETYREGEKTYYSKAEGEVYAQVNRIVEVEIKEIEEKKVPTGESETEFSVNFFGFSVNLFLNSGISYEKYDTIEKNRQIVLFDAVYLPIWIETVTYKEFDTEETKLSEMELRSRAVSEYRGKLAQLSREAELVSITTEHSYDNGVYRIKGNIYCITDISESVPFSIVNESQDDSR